jgi:predicted alpha/beta hydrolase
VGAAPQASQLSRLVFFAPHTGYWRDYAPRWRWALYATWHLFMPAMTLIFGYFPGKKLGLGEDLPARFALDWAGRRKPGIARREESRPIDEILKGYDEIHAPTLAISASDDAIAPPNAAKRLLALYRNLPVKHMVVTPAGTGGQHVGHFGFLRRSTGTTCWEAAATWILSDQPLALVEPKLKLLLDPS